MPGVDIDCDHCLHGLPNLADPHYDYKLVAICCNCGICYTDKSKDFREDMLWWRQRHGSALDKYFQHLRGEERSIIEHARRLDLEDTIAYKERELEELRKRRGK